MRLFPSRDGTGMSRFGGQIRTRWQAGLGSLPPFVREAAPMWLIAAGLTLFVLHVVDRVAAGMAERELTGRIVAEQQEEF